jgi:hypothetical protein
MAGVGMVPNAAVPASVLWHPSSVASGAVAPREVSSIRSVENFFTVRSPIRIVLTVWISKDAIHKSSKTRMHQGNALIENKNYVWGDWI